MTDTIQAMTQELTELTSRLSAENHAIAARLEKLNREIDARQHQQTSPWITAASGLLLAWLNQLPEAGSLESAIYSWRTVSDCLLMLHCELGKEGVALRDLLESALMSGEDVEVTTRIQQKLAENAAAQDGMTSAQLQMTAVLEARGIFAPHGNC